MLPETADRYKGIIFPRKPAFHEVAAPVPIERRYGEFLPIVGDWNLPDCPVSQLEAWDQQGIISINLGPERHDLAANGFGSALEFVAVNCNLELTRAEKKLVEVLARHNTDPKNRGYLNKFHMSVPWMCRELMEFPEYNGHNHLRRVMRVIHVWLRRKDMEDGDKIPERTMETLQKVFDALAEETKARQSDIFTVGQYLANLWLLGESAETIWHEILYWVSGWKKLQQEIRDSKKQFADMPKNWFIAGGLKGLAISTPSKFVSKCAVRNCDVLAVLNPDSGHVAILTNGLNLAELASVLEAEEPGKWYSTGGWLINGGSSYSGARATELWGGLIGLLQKYPPAYSEDTVSGSRLVRQILHR